MFLICSLLVLNLVLSFTDEFDVKDTLAKALKKQQDIHVRVSFRWMTTSVINFCFLSLDVILSVASLTHSYLEAHKKVMGKHCGSRSDAT